MPISNVDQKWVAKIWWGRLAKPLAALTRGLRRALWTLAPAEQVFRPLGIQTTGWLELGNRFWKELIS